VLYELSQTYMFWGDQGGQAYYVKAKELSDRLVEQHPKWPQSWGQRGYVYSRLARTQRGLQAVAKVYDKACENWEKGYSLDPSYVNGLRGLANTRAQEAELYLKSGLRQQGIAAGRKSVAAFERALRAAAEQGTPEGERVSLRAGLERARRLAAGER